MHNLFWHSLKQEAIDVVIILNSNQYLSYNNNIL